MPQLNSQFCNSLGCIQTTWAQNRPSWQSNPRNAPGDIIRASLVRVKRTLPIVLGVLLVAAALTLVVQLRKDAPPEPARLLPGGDAFVYVNLKWVRAVNAVKQLPPVSHDPEYERFIQETGFQFERDLDEAAFAVHYPESWRAGGTAGRAPEPRFSEVFVGKMDGEKLRAYLRKTAASVDNYNGTSIYNIPLEGRTLRVAVLGVDSVGVSNHDDPAVIRGIVDRTHKLASPFAGPAFLRQYYKTVPIASLAWAIARVEPAANTPGFSSLSMLFQKSASVVVSARYLAALHLRAEAFTSSNDDAQTLTDKVTAFLNLFHAAENSAVVQSPDPDVKAFFESLSVSTHGDRAILTAAVPPGFLKKVLDAESGSGSPTADRRAAAPPVATARATQPKARD